MVVHLMSHSNQMKKSTKILGYIPSNSTDNVTI